MGGVKMAVRNSTVGTGHGTSTAARVRGRSQPSVAPRGSWLWRGGEASQVTVEGAVVGFKQLVEGVHAASDVVEENVLLALESVVAGDELLDGAGEVLQGERGLVLSGDEAGSVAVSQEIDEDEEQEQDDKLGAPGD